MRYLRLAVLGLTVISAGIIRGNSQSEGQKSPIDITLTVENEGPGGLFAQLGKDLSEQELALLRSGIEQKILRSKMRHRLVPQDYDKSHLYLSIVVTKVGGSRYVAASSALSIGRVKGTIESVTHDVIVEPDVDRMVSAVNYYLSTAELTAILKLDK